MYYCRANLSGVTTAVVTMTSMRDGPVLPVVARWTGPGIPPPVLHSSPRCPSPRPELSCVKLQLLTRILSTGLNVPRVC